MRIANLTATVHRSRDGWLAALQQHFGGLAAAGGRYPLRFALVQADGGTATLEGTVVEFGSGDPYGEQLSSIEILAPRAGADRTGPFVVVQVVPTGIGCEIGGYAGDACPATNLLAAVADQLVTHPNAVNASELNEMAGNVQYVEGKLLDDFLLGHIALQPVRANRIGTAVDPTGEAYLGELVATLDAAAASAGIDCGRYMRLAGDLGTRVAWSPAGCAVGTVDRPERLLEAVSQLVAEGHDAIGVLSVIHGVTREAFMEHQQRGRPNPSGGVEAIITHLVSKLFRVPSAHAPLPYYTEHKQGVRTDPRSAAEFISTPHYFSVLKGLHRAPRPVPLAEAEGPVAGQVGVGDVQAVVLPASALGGVPALAADFHGIPIIAVEGNRTILSVTQEDMGFERLVKVKSYAEAAGVVLALREGISLASLVRPFTGARELDNLARAARRLRDAS